MEHIEEAGIHSGDSACALPPITLGAREIERIREATEAIARGVGVRGLINIQFALGADILYVLEANPRASRTVPVRLQGDRDAAGQGRGPDHAGRLDQSLRAEGLLPAEGDGGTLPADAPIAVKEAVMPFNRFRGPTASSVDTVLGPEMRSTGEVMGLDADFGTAFAKSQAAAYGSLPTSGPGVRVDGQPRQALDDLPGQGARRPRLRDPRHPGHRRGAAPQRRRTRGVVRKHFEGPGPNGEKTTVQLIHDGEIDLVVNTPHGSRVRAGPSASTATRSAPPRSMPTSRASPPSRGSARPCRASRPSIRGDIGVRSLQDWARGLKR